MEEMEYMEGKRLVRSQLESLSNLLDQEATADMLMGPENNNQS